jgi:hypothetical protein
MFAVAIPVIYNIAGGIDYASIDAMLPANEGVPVYNDTVTTGIISGSNFTVNLTVTPAQGNSSITNVSQLNNTIPQWIGINTSFWNYLPALNRVNFSSVIVNDNTTAFRVIYNANTTTTPTQNASDNVISNLATFFAIAPMYLIIIAAVGVITAILLLRKQ